MLGWLDFLPTLPRWLILILLSLNLIPLANGIIQGLILSDYRARVYDDSVRHFIENRAEASYMSFQDNVGVEPFHVPKIRDPQAWWAKLGMKRFDVASDDGEAPINIFAQLGSLYREDAGDPWHHWVYISPYQLHIEGLLFSQWDKAFNELLRYHYRNPGVGNASFHYIPSPRSFLCLQWHIRGPALMHFTTEVATLTSKTLPNRPTIPGYSPVAVRLIELPLKDAESSPLIPGTFPSVFKQMKSVTEDPYAWQMFNIYSEPEQLQLRLRDMLLEKEREYPRTFGRLLEAEDWLLDNFNFLSALDFWFSSIRTSGMIAFVTAWNLVEIATDILRSSQGSSDDVLRYHDYGDSSIAHISEGASPSIAWTYC